ncbi:tetratricopeptide repeat protein [Chitinibacter sp. S2-10]|uniref:tetratricopeptide repeat protein n=1 Tax=Chitinibacter sp. S2-10 TaxID=3373597 RepID=UPI0039776D7A
MSALRSMIIALPLLFSMAVHAGEGEDIQQLIRTKQYTQAIERADKALAKSPKDAQLRFLRGIALSEMGRSDEAIKAFTQISEDYPQLPEPYNNLAVLYANKGQFDKARAALQLAIQTNPSYAIAHENMGDLYARLASQAYDKALQLENNNPQVQTKLKLIDSLFGQQGNRLPPSKPVATSGAQKPIMTAQPTMVAAVKATATPKVTATPKATAVATLAAKATEKPTPSPTASSKPATSSEPQADSKQVIASVQNWAEAWSRQNVTGYINNYSKNFKAPGGRAAWEQDRQAKISAPKSIDVTVSDIKVEMLDETTAKVRLRQNYKSDRLSSSTVKTLVMEKSGSRWLIREERIGG